MSLKTRKLLEIQKNQIALSYLQFWAKNSKVLSPLKFTRVRMNRLMQALEVSEADISQLAMLVWNPEANGKTHLAYPTLKALLKERGMLIRPFDIKHQIEVTARATSTSLEDATQFVRELLEEILADTFDTL